MAQASEGKDQLEKPKNVEMSASFSRLKQIDQNTLHSEAISIAWKAVKDVIAHKLMGERGCAVPYLEEASKYGLLNVLVKEKKRLTDKLARKPSIVHWSAPLEHILPSSISVDQFRETNKVELIDRDSADGLSFHIQNHAKASDKGKNFKQCDVKVNLFGLQHYKIGSDSQEIQVDLKTHFQGVDNIERVYLITEVYVVRSFVMTVTAGDSKYQWDCTRMMPVGFVFRKCEITGEGLLKYGLEVDRKKALEYNWVTENCEESQVRQVKKEKLVKTEKPSA